MKRRKQNLSPEERASNKRLKDQIRSWRQHPSDPWAELERLGMTEDIARLGWPQPRVTRAMNSVASEERFRLKVHRAMQLEGDKPIYLAGGVGRPGTPAEDHGYTHDPNRSIDPDGDVIDFPTRDRLEKETALNRARRLGDLVSACEEIRAVIDDKVREKPDFMALAGRDVWLVRSRIDAMMRNLKRKAAA